ncbi:endonuclease NucS domain-containing protein [Vreelandella glaciei]|uniref:endonuclease NucS domain-containing protein n=1 Tax=Vreelandella glaciei TaxID=186761 RepID=UPI0030EB2539|tara:strand:- start:244 stop:990 length:747 start_codon:yes stop_codon:yes gene_type:complete
MQQERYKAWLELQKYQSNTITAQMHRVGRVEEHYGNLDEHFEKDLLESVIDGLRYSTADRQVNKPNPSKIPFNGDPYSNLASYRDAVNRYKKFRTDETILVETASDDDDTPSTVPPSAAAASTKQSISLERDLQATLRESIAQLESGLEIIDEGAERSVDSGFIDITARDCDGVTVVIELKTGTASQRAIAQILSYMGDVLNEEVGSSVRGILVASNFDSKARSAARMVPNLQLKRYKVEFSFTDGEC